MIILTGDGDMSDRGERHIVVKDNKTKSGYRELLDCWDENYPHRYILVPTSDYPSGYAAMGFQYDEFKMYEVVKVFSTTKEAVDCIHEHKKEK